MTPRPMSSTLRGGLVVAGLAFLTACGNDDRPASFEYIQTAIIAPNCATASCHSAENAQAGIRLHDVASSYSILTGRACGGPETDQTAPRNYVDPGNPERSRLMYLLLGIEVRLPMPPERALPGGDIDLVERWILEGARCN